MRKLITLTLVTAVLGTSVFTNQVSANDDVITSASVAKSYTYTDSSALQKKIGEIIDGKAGLKSKTPVGCHKLNASNSFSVTGKDNGQTVRGYQCYIYANAVYNKLFGETIGHGTNLKKSKKLILNGGRTASYNLFKKLGVRTGAYLRASVSKSGNYNSDGGHSLIILSYDENMISYIDGNSNGRGLVAVTRESWKDFNRRQLSGISRRIHLLVQPKATYYDKMYNVPKTTKINKISSNNQYVTVKWKKIKNISGYQVVCDNYAPNIQDKLVTVNNASNKTVINLNNNSRYNLKVRAFKSVNNKVVYGSWSKAKTVTINYRETNNPQIVSDVQETTVVTDETCVAQENAFESETALEADVQEETTELSEKYDKKIVDDEFYDGVIPKRKIEF
ncbi:MAG: fibronectin type III domain-containing protein [Lachnospiraceae bacterium]|nr:fibronectin type III domain-containing protein [Lachnospiraceae bacterium]